MDKFQYIVETCRRNPSTENKQQLAWCFDKLAWQIMNSLRLSETRPVTTDDCVIAAFERLDSYNPTRPAFNYFSTVILNHLRSQYKRQKLAEKYAEILYAIKWSKQFGTAALMACLAVTSTFDDHEGMHHLPEKHTSPPHLPTAVAHVSTNQEYVIYEVKLYAKADNGWIYRQTPFAPVSFAHFAEPDLLMLRDGIGNHLVLCGNKIKAEKMLVSLANRYSPEAVEQQTVSWLDFMSMLETMLGWWCLTDMTEEAKTKISNVQALVRQGKANGPTVAGFEHLLFGTLANLV